jgi:hypothetical protein
MEKYRMQLVDFRASVIGYTLCSLKDYRRIDVAFFKCMMLVLGLKDKTSILGLSLKG